MWLLIITKQIYFINNIFKYYNICKIKFNTHFNNFSIRMNFRIKYLKLQEIKRPTALK